MQTEEPGIVVTEWVAVTSAAIGACLLLMSELPDVGFDEAPAGRAIYLRTGAIE